MESHQPSAPKPPAAAPRKRSLFAFFFKTTIGCAAFLFGSLVALVLLLPTVCGGFVARAAAGAFTERFSGSLAVGAADLAWFSAQRIDGVALFDPDGREVARLNVTLPALVDLARGGGRRIGKIRIELDADLVADDAGRTNLERALAPRAAHEGGGAGADGSRSTSASDRFLDELDVDLEIVAQRVRWSDARTRRAGAPFEVRDLVATLRAVPGQPIALHAAGRVVSDAPGTLVVDAALTGPFGAAQAAPFSVLDAHARIEGFPSALIDGVAGLDGALQELVGPRFSLRVDAHATSLEAGDATVLLAGDRAEVQFSATLASGVLRATSEPGIRARFDDPSAFVARRLQRLLPTRAAPAVSAPTAPWTVRASRFAVSLAGLDTADGAALWRALRDADLALAIEAPSVFAFASEATRAPGLPAAVAAPRVELTAESGGRVAARFTCAVDTGVPGEVEFLLDAVDPWTHFARGAFPPVEARARVSSLATAGVFGPFGLAARGERAFGPTFDVDLDVHEATPAGARIELALGDRTRGERVTLAASVVLGETSVRVGGADESGARLEVPASLACREIAALLPAESVVECVDPKARLTVRARDVEMRFADPLRGTRADLQLGVPALRVARPAARFDQTFSSLALEVHVAPDAAATARLVAEQPGVRPARIDLDVRVPDPWRAFDAGSPGPFDARARLSNIASATVDALLGQPGLVSEVVGPEFGVDLVLAATSAAEGRATLDVRSTTTTFHAAGRFDAEQVTFAGDEGLDLSLALTPETVARWTAGLFPPGTRVTLEPGAGPVACRLRDASVPFSAFAARPTPADPADSSSAPAVFLERSSALALRFEADLPAIRYSDPSTEELGKPVSLRDVRLEVALAPDAPPSARLACRVVDDPPGALAVDVRALEPWGKLARAGGLDAWRAHVDARASNVPTAIVDALAGQHGLLVEALGSRIAITAQAPDVSLGAGGFSCDLRSDLHSVHAEGHVESRAIVIDRVDGLVADVGLGPLMSEKVVGRLVPMLFDLEKAPGAAPARFAVDALRFPFDGDWSRLDADVRLDLGDVSYRVLPGFEAWLGDLTAMKATRLPALRVAVRKGVARYDKLPIRISGHELAFSGSYDLAAGTMKLVTEVPLSILGKKVSAKLEGVRDVLDPKTMIPIEVRGTWSRPSFALADGFLDKLLEGAARKGLGELLDGLGKKKKKN